MSLWVLDSANPPNLASVKAVGVGASRYVKKNLPNSFDLGSQERLNILGAGLGLWYNAEQSANDVLVQSTSYFADYGKYVSDRLQAFGVNPKGVNIPLSSDCQVSSANLPKVMNNHAAFAANCGPFGMVGYGQMNVCQLLTAEGISPKGAKHWLTSAIGWSGLPNTKAGWQTYIQFPYAGMVQLGPQAVGFFNAPTVAGCDTNLLLDPHSMGFEWPAGSPYLSKDDMAPTIWALNPTTVPTGLTEPWATGAANLVFITEAGRTHWDVDGLEALQITTHASAVNLGQFSWSAMLIKLVETYGPGGWVPIFPGADFGCGVGVTEGGQYFAQLPGPAPTTGGSVDMTAVATAAQAGAAAALDGSTVETVETTTTTSTFTPKGSS